LTNQRISTTTKTTMIIPTHTPALKMPPTTAQEDRTNINTNALSQTVESFFIILFGMLMQKLCRYKPSALSNQLSAIDRTSITDGD
jgi:hypothetical protein